MGEIHIKIHDFEKNKMIIVISKHPNETLSVAALAKFAGYNPNRLRFILDEMLEEGSIVKTCTRSVNSRYLRYSYKITGRKVTNG